MSRLLELKSISRKVSPTSGDSNVPVQSEDKSGVTYTVPVLLVILALAVLIRVSFIPRETAWYDEFSTIRHLNAESLGLYLDEVRKSNAPVPPLYLTVEYYWARYVGDSEVSLRVLSLIPGILSIFMGFLVVGHIHSRTAGLLTAYLMAVSPTHVFYSNEIRMYSLVLMFVLILLYTYIQLLKSPTLALWILHTMTTIALVWTHILSVFVLPCLAVHCYIFGLMKWRTKIIWTGLHAMAVLTIIPWLYIVDFPEITGQYDFRVAPTVFSKIDAPSVPSVQRALYSWISVGEHRWLSAPVAWLLRTSNVLIAAGFLAGIGGLLWNVGRCLFRRDYFKVDKRVFMLGLFFIPITMLFVLSHIWEPCFIPRYILSSWFALMACLSISITIVASDTLRKALIACLVVCTLIQVYVDIQIPQRDDWSAVVRVLEEKPSRSPILHVLAHPKNLPGLQNTLGYHLQNRKAKSIPYFGLDALKKYLLDGYAQKRVGNRFLGDVVIVFRREDFDTVREYLDIHGVHYDTEPILTRSNMVCIRLNPPESKGEVKRS